MTEFDFYLWLVTVGTLIGGFVFLSLKTTPQLAIAIATGGTLIVPAWILIPLFETPDGTIVASGLDVKLAVTASCLFLYCFMPGRTFPLRLVPSDFAMIGLVAVHLASDVSNSGFTWMILARMYAEWFAPYVAGRLAFQAMNVPPSLWKMLAISSALLGLFAVIESLTKFNVFEFIAGERPYEGFSREESRWGLRRAYGPTMHPIYFGGLQLLLFAWPVFGLAQALRGRVFYGWIFLPILPVLGIFATGSRGPIIGLFFFSAAVVFFLFQKSRIPIIVSSVLFIAIASLNFYWIVERLEEWSGEARAAQFSRLSVDGKNVVASGTRSRLIMLDVYRIAITRSGLLGYGTISTSGFPVNVPISGQEIRTLKRIKYIDNAYILLTLRFGYAGIGFFLFACAASLWQYFWITRSQTRRSIHFLCATLAASLTASYFLIATVWLPSEVSYPMLWTMGISSGLFHTYLNGGREKGDTLQN